jgi:putative salt-induced outer membrane protein YdiY
MIAQRKGARTLRPAALALVCVALALAGPVRAAAQDVVVLTNGDRISGQLVGVAGGTWTIKHPGGELKLDAASIASFSSAGDVGVRFPDGTIAAGRVVATDGGMRFVGADGTTRSVTVADLLAVGSATNLEALRALHIGFLSPFGRFWRASIGAGFVNTSGNSRSRGVNGDLKIERATSKDRLAFGFGTASQWSPDDAGDLVKSVEKYYGSARLDVVLSGAVYLFAGTLQEIDKFQGLDLRSNYNAGAGYQVLALSQTNLRFDLSGGLRVENFTPTAGDTTISTPIWSAGSQLKQKLGPVTLDWALRWTPAVDDIKDYRFLSDAGLATTIFKGLGFRIGSRNEYNNNPPVGIKRHDWLFTTNFTYSLGG